MNLNNVVEQLLNEDPISITIDAAGRRIFSVVSMTQEPYFFLTGSRHSLEDFEEQTSSLPRGAEVLLTINYRCPLRILAVRATLGQLCFGPTNLRIPSSAMQIEERVRPATWSADEIANSLARGNGFVHRGEQSTTILSYGAPLSVSYDKVLIEALERESLVTAE